MNKLRKKIAIVVLIFSLLWLPLGQYDFLINHWMKIGTFAAPVFLIGFVLSKKKKRVDELLNNFEFVGIILLIAYIIHQFEEHWIDIYGNQYAFYTFNNAFIVKNLGQPESLVKPLTKASIFIINTSLVWLVGALGIISSPKHLFPLIAMAGIIVVNGLVHIVASIVNSTYNPGLMTSIFVFIPIYAWFLRFLLKKSDEFKILIIGGLIWAFLAHVIMVVGLLQANWFKVIPELLYWVVLVIWSVLPIFLYRKKCFNKLTF